ncbi:MAG TPA: glycoside hydrolase family 88 protein [Bacillota bacterium]|nr:glycoside hydrolase family 88 protein [Bacillota bacterium]
MDMIDDTPMFWAEHACETLMAKFEPAQLPPAGRWHYHQGVFLKGMLMVWKKTGQQKYFDYVKGYVDSLVDDNGSFEFRNTELDSIQAGLLLFDLYEVTKKEKYKIAADQLISFMTGWKKTNEGGFWHKEIYPYQMWLDGLYMAGPFAVQYATVFNRPELYDLVVQQAELMLKNTKDEKTGLLHHAWDESRQAVWANPETGKSPEFWSRSIGWVVVALVEILDYLPKDHPKRGFLIHELKSLIEAVAKQQDPKTGMWFQVTDKGDQPDNWVEHSASCLFVYGMAKAIRMGYVDAKYQETANRGFEGLLKMVTIDEDGKVTIPEICIGTGVGDYAHYIARPRSTNDLHGVGAFLFACVEMSK